MTLQEALVVETARLDAEYDYLEQKDAPHIHYRGTTLGEPYACGVLYTVIYSRRGQMTKKTLCSGCEYDDSVCWAGETT